MADFVQLLAQPEQLVKIVVGYIWSTPLYLLLLGCGLIFSIATKFVQFRIMSHGIACIRGTYDKPGDTGHISHFQALSAALSATIGIGNIGGVAIAVSLGGPGAIFWMWIVGLFGMALKYMECTLAVMFRDVRDVPDPSAPALMQADAENRSLGYPGEEPPAPGSRTRARGEVRGGPMWYIEKGIVEPLRRRHPILATAFKVLAVLFAGATIINSLGSGNIFQGWNVKDVLVANFGVPAWLSATIVSALVALVIIGGIKRIGQVAAKLVPGMCVIYIVGAFAVMIANADQLPHCFGLIFKHAFTPIAGEGAFAGTVFAVAFGWGLRRACFSNEAGEGSAPIAHAAARTEEPIREGVVAGIGPFVDTIIICTMTAMVLLSTGVWNRPPVGTVSAVHGDLVTVLCNQAVPEHLQASYLREIQEGSDEQRPKTLVAYLNHEPGQDPDTIALKIVQIDRLGDDDWSQIASLILRKPSGDTPSESRPTETPPTTPSLQVGTPIHLRMMGAEMTRFAFDVTLPGFGKYILTIGVCLFAFSTLISWSYYGEKGAEYLFGPAAILMYKIVFVLVVFAGMMMPSFDIVYNISDITVGLMVLCNLPAVLILSPTVLRAGRKYFQRLDAGEMPPTRERRR